MATDNSRWFVVHTYSGYEKKVQKNILTAAVNKKLTDQILDVKIPVEIVETPTPTKEKEEEKDEILLAMGDYEDDDEDEDDLTDAELAARRRKQAKKAKKKAETEKPKEPKERLKFPGYVFVKINCVYKKVGDYEDEILSMSDEVWYVIRNTRGVTSFVGPGSRPVPISDDEVQRFSIEEKVKEVDYNVGDRVVILSGSFDGYTGIVDKIDLDEDTVTVLVSFLGRDTPVNLPLNQVDAEE